MFCAFTSDGATTLGLTFSLDGVHPIIPTLSDITQDPALENSRVVVRRFAYRASPLPGRSHWLRLECGWLESGILACISHIISQRPDYSHAASRVPPYSDHVESRYFSAATADLMHARICALAGTEHVRHSGAWPSDPILQRTPYDFYATHHYEIEGVTSCPFCATRGLSQCTCPRMMQKHIFGVDTDGLLGDAQWQQSDHLSDLLGADPNRRSHELDGTLYPVMATENEKSLSYSQPFSALQWGSFRRDVMSASRSGLIVTRFFEIRPGLAPVEWTEPRLVPYRFLSADGLKASHGIQHICVQLGIHLSSPHPDQLLHFPIEVDDAQDTDMTDVNAINTADSFGMTARLKSAPLIFGVDTNEWANQSHSAFDPDRTHHSDFATDEGGVEQSASDEEELDLTATGGKKQGLWKCQICGVQLRGKKGNLNRHISSVHLRSRTFVCTEANCERSFQTRANLNRHLRAVHFERQYQCGECPRAFKTADDRTRHVQSAHQSGETSACHICGRCFGRRSELNRHIANVHRADT